MDEMKKNEIVSIINQKYDDPFELLLNICDIFSSDNDNYGLVLQILVENFSIDKDYKKTKKITRDDIILAEKKYLRLLESTVYVLSYSNPAPITFYEKLYENIFHSEQFSFTDNTEKALLLYLLTKKINLLPYYQIQTDDAPSKEQFHKLISTLSQEIQQSIHIFYRDIPRRTEEATALYNLLESLEDRNQKIVLLSAILQLKEKIENTDQ